MPSDKRLSTAE